MRTNKYNFSTVWSNIYYILYAHLHLDRNSLRGFVDYLMAVQFGRNMQQQTHETVILQIYVLTTSYLVTE